MQSRQVFQECQNFMNQAVQLFKSQYPPGSRSSESITNFKNRISKQMDAPQNQDGTKKEAQHLEQMVEAFFEQIDELEESEDDLIPKQESDSEEYSSDDSDLSDSQSQGKEEESQNSEEEEKDQRGKMRRRKYAVYDQEFKQQVCAVADQKGISHATTKFNLPTRKVLNWIEAHNNNLLGKGRKALDPVMEYNLSIWLLRKIWDRIPLTQKIIREKAVTMKTLSRKFNGSKGWLEKFFLRHVQLKSCFDYRNQDDMREECAKYHRYAFSRVEKDYQDFLKAQAVSKTKLIGGNLTELIYFAGDHPFLKLRQDRKIDREARGGILYEYELMLAQNNDADIKKKQESQSEYISDSFSDSDSELYESIRKRVKKEESQQYSECESEIYDYSSSSLEKVA